MTIGRTADPAPATGRRPGAGDCAVAEGAQLHALLQPVSGFTAQAALSAEHEALALEWRTRILELLGWLRNAPAATAGPGSTEASRTDA